jgi:hypothetical protein
VDYSIPPPHLQHSRADALRLVDAIRAIAYEPSYRSDPADQMRRIRDLFLEHDRLEDDS